MKKLLGLCLITFISFSSLATQMRRVQPFPGTQDIIQEMAIWNLGTKNIKHVWVVLHGDRPKYYEQEMAQVRLNLHRALKRKKQGALLIMPLAHPFSYFKVPAGQGWGDIYGKSPQAQKLTQSRSRFGLMPIRLFRAVEKQLKNKNLLFQLVSFSGAGRVDRAFHEVLIDGYNRDRTQLSLKDFVDHHLLAHSAADAMVHWSFADSERKPLVTSWTHFLSRFPHVKSTHVYDRSKRYPYMAQMIQDILSHQQGHTTQLPLRGRTYGQLHIESAQGHKQTLWHKLDAMLLKWLP